ncbi:hypothetical protein [Amaricoccus solimangrovi]|uniref:Uncharacterized protein n=1 Tax=Amaricoccus solimangrovi TaxID=2589815 RepID=A0A501WVU5_9RHOB|nr:hypothetical protein [Amaricoccus solimangrovi]TPE52540.1 hypothetical protein FJM51_04995 [Amaricoccus solimangrovi]
MTDATFVRGYAFGFASTALLVAMLSMSGGGMRHGAPAFQGGMEQVDARLFPRPCASGAACEQPRTETTARADVAPIRAWPSRADPAGTGATAIGPIRDWAPLARHDVTPG